MKLYKLKPDMIVYDVKRSTGLHIFNSKWSVWPVKILEVNEQENKVYASWNYNKPEWYCERTWSKWRIKYPQG